MSNVRVSDKQTAFAKWWASRSSDAFNKNNSVHLAYKDAWYSGYASGQRNKKGGTLK